MGRRLPAGSVVMVGIYALQRNPAYWPEPAAFRLGRNPPRGAYLPFGAGPRGCLGARLARLEVAVLIEEARGFQLTAEAAEVGARPGLTLRPDGPVWLRVEPR